MIVKFLDHVFFPMIGNVNNVIKVDLLGQLMECAWHLTEL